MFLLREPSEEQIWQFIASQRELPFSYAEVGATQAGAPDGYTVDHNRIKLGEGRATYERAIDALRRWWHFDLGWVRIVAADTPVEVGPTVAVLARHLGFWSLNASRVVYLIDDEKSVKLDASYQDRMQARMPALPGRFGFAYGTLPDHAERGEERFTIEWHTKDDSVWYDILAFSRPNKLLARIAYPVARRLQKQFARESLAKMIKVSRE